MRETTKAKTVSIAFVLEKFQGLQESNQLIDVSRCKEKSCLNIHLSSVGQTWQTSKGALQVVHISSDALRP